MCSSFNLKDYSITEEDRMIIYTKEIVTFLNNIPLKKYRKDGKSILGDINEYKPEDISSNIISFLEPFDLEIDFTGDELIIWSDFNE